MKNSIVLFFSILLIFCFSELRAQYTLSVQLSEVQNSKGNLMVSLYTADNFLSAKSHASKAVIPAGAAKKTVTFNNLTAGTYAVAVCHDENKNGDCDRSVFGFPKEGFGFSNNFKPKFSAPTFRDAAFRLNSNSNQIIRLIYKLF